MLETRLEAVAARISVLLLASSLQGTRVATYLSSMVMEDHGRQCCPPRQFLAGLASWLA